MLQEFTKTVLLIAGALFPVINPPAAGFIVLSLLPGATAMQRADLARRISLNGLVILVVSLTVGAYVLSFFGISIPVLRVAGGVVIAVAGWKLLQSPSNEKNKHAAEASKDCNTSSMSELAFYPLTLPITVGPGSIAVAIALGSRSPEEGLSAGHLAGVGVALLILVISIYLCIRFAVRVERLLGAAGMAVTMRLFSFILFCIGMQILWLGLSELIESLKLK